MASTLSQATWSAVQAANKPTAPDSARSGDSEPDVAFDTAHSGPPLTSRSMAVDSACSVALDAASLRGPPADECSVCVAVHVRPLIQQEVDAGAVYSLPVTLGEPQVGRPCRRESTECAAAFFTREALLSPCISFVHPLLCRSRLHSTRMLPGPNSKELRP